MTTTFKTRLVKGGDAVATVATIDWTGVTEVQLKELAERSVIIAMQAIYRTAGHIPAKDEIKVAPLLAREKGGFKVTPESLAARINKMTPEEKAFILSQITRK